MPAHLSSPIGVAEIKQVSQRKGADIMITKIENVNVYNTEKRKFENGSLCFENSRIVEIGRASCRERVCLSV